MSSMRLFPPVVVCLEELLFIADCLWRQNSYVENMVAISGGFFTRSSTCLLDLLRLEC